jgi:FemAB-related protein (PEP-CTERM system-associated)
MTVSDDRCNAAQPSVARYGGDAAAWDAFVRRTPGGTVFHLIGWKEALEQTFGFTAHYLEARRDGELVGVLPLFELRAPLMDRCLLSLPFAVEAGVCSVDPAAQRALDAAALALAAERGARTVELRDGRDAAPFRLCEGRYVHFHRALYADDAANLAATPPKRRYMIRQGIRHGLSARVDAADLAVFHDLYARTARHFGTPVFPLRFFRALLQHFPAEAALLVVRLGSTPVAGTLAFFFDGVVCPYYAGSRREFFRYAVNDFMYWELMRYACARGARRFDFGRSKIGTGAYTFKQLWGFTPEPLRYRVATLGDGAASARSSSDPAIAWLQRVWQHLPLPVTKLFGPYVVGRYGAYFT